MEKIVQHPHGIARDLADFLILGVQVDEGDTLREQLWAKKRGEHEFELCCLPFYLYGLSLGDLVSTNDQFHINAVIKRSDRSLLRFWFGEGCSDVEALQEKLADFDARAEWYTYKLVSIDLPRRQLSRMIDWLEAEMVNLGLEYEVANG